MSSTLFNVNDHIARITLNRPEKLNAFNREMALELQSRLDTCSRDNSIKVVLITGAGRAFSAGQDLSEICNAENPGIGKILSELYNPIIHKITSMNKPVVAAINGIAAGAGANIGLSCDISVATKSASFIQAFSKIGLIPDSGGTFFLPRLVGWQKASALMMLSEKITAAEAAQMGMIYKFFEDEVFESSVNDICTQLANMPATGLAYTKRALQASFHNSLHNQLIEEDELQQQAAGSPEFLQRVRAFIKK
jgi:2-(1,2-epoxy-1,2-dihydrophenyl)acetyl-CoA isomerase